MYRIKKLTDLWVKFLDYTRKVCMLLSFMSMVVCFVLMLWYSHLFDVKRTIVMGAVVCVSIFLNHSLQE